MGLQSNNLFVVCYNASAKEPFAVSEAVRVDRKYRKNFYRVELRLNFHEKDVNIHEREQMRRLCYKQIIEKMTSDKLWQCHDSLYFLTYRVRLLRETISEFLSRQRAQEVYDELQNTDDSYSSYDSAYFSLLSESFGDVSLDDESNDYGSDDSVIDSPSLPLLGEEN